MKINLETVQRPNAGQNEPVSTLPDSQEKPVNSHGVRTLPDSREKSVNSHGVLSTGSVDSRDDLSTNKANCCSYWRIHVFAIS